MTATAWFLRPRVWVELFAVANLAFLAVDIYVAHSFNGFRHPAEWIPFIFSLVAPLVLVAIMAAGGSVEPPRSGFARALGLVVGWTSVVIGVAGLVFHLLDTFFVEQTIKNLVYTAPFVAPLSYTGIGLLLLLDRMVSMTKAGREWAQWVILLALGGFFGNFILCLADHAQNGFFDSREWIGVIASALAVGFLLTVLLVDESPLFLRLCRAVLLVQIATGLLGFYYHAAAIRGGPMERLWENIVYGTPAFAPLLFSNLALLALVGLWGLELYPRARSVSLSSALQS
ncbi:MAG: hypothetical protein IH936_12320 [Acidobacteria bacterium]|nr:hypothetical protein [Acidobacteriota bacterium]